MDRLAVIVSASCSGPVPKLCLIPCDSYGDAGMDSSLSCAEELSCDFGLDEVASVVC